MKHTFQFRSGTLDEWIFHSVSEANEYRLPEAFNAEDIIVDIGMHIGSFCYAALQRGSCRVHGFEADASNIERAASNLKPFGGRVSLHHKAVWRSDEHVGSLGFYHSTDAANTGGGGVFWSGGTSQVDAIPFDEMILDITDGGRFRVRLLKIDCEGSEFPILLTSRTLHLIDQIIGEFHEFKGDYDSTDVLPEATRIPGFNRFTIVELADVLQRAGFEVTWERQPPGSSLGLFFANQRLPSQAGLTEIAFSLAKRIFLGPKP